MGFVLAAIISACMCRGLCCGRRQSFPPPVVPAEVHGNGQKVAFQVPVSVAFHIPDEAQERILCQVIGVLPAAGLVAAEIIDVVIIFFGNLIQIFFLSGLDAPYQLPIIQKASLLSFRKHAYI